jgi:hypothetical protein
MNRGRERTPTFLLGNHKYDIGKNRNGKENGRSNLERNVDVF